MPIYSSTDKKSNKLKAQVFEISEKIVHTFCHKDNTIPNKKKEWIERRILIYSLAYAQSVKKIFNSRLEKATNELAVIMERKSGRSVPKNQASLQKKVNQILKKHQVEKFFDIKIAEKEVPKKVRYQVKRKRTKKIKTEIVPTLSYSINQTAKQQHVDTLGWQVYATNAPQQRLNIQQVVECYHAQYQIEHKFNELLNKVTVLMPVFLQKEHRIKALINLLLVALKFTTMIERTVRKGLKDAQQKIKKVYAGNPNRATNKPSIKQILSAFYGLTAIFIFDNDVTNNIRIEITPSISENQVQILTLLGLSSNIYIKFEKLTNFDFEISET